MKTKRILSLALILLLVFSLALSGCGSKDQPPGNNSEQVDNEDNAANDVADNNSQDDEEPADTPDNEGDAEPAITEYGEAPDLKELVDKGELPPVEERLPEEPLIYVAGTEVPLEDMPELEIGKYGGTLRVINPGSPGGGEWWAINREPLLNQPGFGEPGEKPFGNVVKDFDMVDDGKTFVFHMRKGLKWSDGEPVTTEDVRFAFEDVLHNEELTPQFPKWLSNLDGTPCELNILDEHTFEIKFKESYALFPYTLSLHWQTWDSGPIIQPAHYMKKFHINYTSQEELKPLLEENGLEDNEWYRLFSLYSWAGGGLSETKIGCPTLTAYVLEEMPDAQTAILRRNPYYFKVDAAGNQLPYIDEIRASTVASVEMLPMEIMGGQADLARQAISVKEIALYKENEEKGGYTVGLYNFHCPIPITFNYSNPEREWTEIIENRQFREALNLALDRDEIIDAVYNGLASPSDFTPGEHNPDKANELLDSIGLDQRDSEGWRLRPDGKRMELLIETSAPSTDFIPMIEIIVENWRDIGIYTTMNQVDGSLLGTRQEADETRVVISSWMDLPVARSNPYMIDWVFLNDRAKVSEGFRKWYVSFGQEGVEPPDDLKPAFDLYDQVRSSKTFDEVGTNLQKWEEFMGESLFLIIPVEDIAIPLIYNSKIRNVPESGNGYQIMANFAAEVFYYDE
ncbi:MAG: ABC transporter substrate-binding protein [Caldicoprobacterales bacterium]